MLPLIWHTYGSVMGYIKRKNSNNNNSNNNYNNYIYRDIILYDIDVK